MKLTNKDLQLFKTECDKWINKLGLIGWDVNYEMKDLNGNRAELEGIYEARVATLLLNYDADVFYFPEGSISKQVEIKSSAKHEVLELFLYRLRVMAFDRNIDKSEWDSETHQIIHTLEGLI